MVERAREAIGRIPSARHEKTRLVYTAHSIPLSMSQNCRYVEQLNECCRLINEHLGWDTWNLVYQSRSGPPQQPWLEPDVCDFLRQLRDTTDIRDVVIVPIGFISDHMEVLFDLDTEAMQHAEQLEINLVRAATAGTHPRFIQMIRELVEERMSDDPHRTRAALGDLGPSPDVCPPDCCPSGRPHP